MSYILDALRRAEAERRIGPSAASQVSTVLGAPLERASSRPERARWLAWPAAGIAVVVAASAGIWFGAYQAKAPAVVPSVAAPAPAQAVPQQQTVAPAPEKATPPVEKIAPAAPVAVAEAETPKRSRENIKPKASVKKPRVAAAPQPAPRPAAVEEPPVPGLRELPEAMQRDIPPLAIGGYIYSANKADRTVLINTKLLREGDEVTPGLRLEKLMPNGMVLNFKGNRYRMPY